MDNRQREVELLERISQTLDELSRRMHVTSYASIRRILARTLDTDSKRLVYHCLDGRSTMIEIQDKTGVNVRFISEWGREWEKIGIVSSSTISTRKGRRQKQFELETFGIQVPDLPSTTEDS